MTNLRKLAAIDTVFLGYKLVLAEYVCGVVLSIALGIFTLSRSATVWGILLGAYLVSIGINYIPMLVFTLWIGNKERAKAELGDELARTPQAMARYRRTSLLLLVPLMVAVIAAAEVCSSRSKIGKGN
jgi:hypothetical protein